jgi:hypothetical protein
VIGDSGPDAPRCSRAGCRESANWNVQWRNPRIHGPDRVKVWLACDEHRDYLHDYLAARSFPVAVTPFGETIERLPESTP